jgi:uncharacterized protein (TIGR02145 family)
MKLPIISLVFIIIPLQISGQGITKHGRSAAEAPDFVNRNGKLINMPSLNRYGQELFKVTVTTFPVTSVTSNSAESGGRIENPDNIEIIACGVCWSTSPGPDISDYKTSENTDVTEFTSHLTRLIPSTTYYLRAYVTTIAGTAYGEEISFRTLPRTDPSECLIAWYPFNGNADEATGFGIDGIVNGAVLSEDRFGNTESAYYFNGIDNSITIPGYLPVTNTFTLSFWAYNEKVKGSANIITDGSRNIGGMDFLLNFRGNEIGIRADKGSLLNYEYSSPAELRNLNLLNRWVHVAWVMDEGKSSIFLDGAKIADIAVTGSNVGYHDDHITIGARHVWTAMDNFFQGRLDEFRIYSCNLQPDEIYSIYTAEGPMLPYVTTVFISDTTSSSITVESNIISDGGTEVTERGVVWSTSLNPTIHDNKTSDGSGKGSFTSHITGLLPGTTYYLKSYAINNAGTFYGNEWSFRTHDTLSNCGTVTDIDGNIYNTVTIGNQCWMKENLKTTRYSDGTPISLVDEQNIWSKLSISDKAYCWYNNDINNKNPYGALYTWAAAMNGADSSTSIPSGIQGVCPTGWHLPSWSEWGILIQYLDPQIVDPLYLRGSSIAGGKMKESGFTYWDYPNTGATNESGFSGLPGGGRSEDGEFLFLGNSSYWWSTSQFGSGNYTRVQNLNYNNSSNQMTSTPWKSGISVRCIKNVDQLIQLPVITTTQISHISDTSATSGGKIINNGGDEIIARGICWSLSTNPTTTNNKTNSGTGTGLFIDHIGPLTPGTTYYVRAYATNSAGTAYGNEEVFVTCDYIPPVAFNSNLAYGVITDIEGNFYKTIKIGNQEWMAENLRTTKYNNGESIPVITDNDTWQSLSEGALCWLNDNICYKNTYGGIYNWYAANNNLCPVGWHLPTNEEWSVMNRALGGNEIAGGKLKEQGFSHWSEPNTGATNESGFSALPTGGFRNGALFVTGEFASFWTSTEYPDNQAFYRSLQHQYSIEGYSWGYKSNGANVRCLKGPAPPKPSVTTLWARNIMSDKAEIVSVISSVLPVNSRGVCWNTSPAPEVLDNKTTNDGGTGSFTSLLTGLESNTTYYVRAYSINDDGITYGNEITFSTVEDLPIGGLAAYWPFNGNANDESGNNNNGTVYGATLVADRFGNPEKAYYFNGISNKIYIGNSLIVQGHITVACWIKSTDIGNQIISSGSRNSYRIGKTKDGVDAAVYLTDSSDGYGLDVHAVTDCSDWTHVAIVYNGVSLDLYVNGQLMDSAYGPGNVFCNQPVYLNFGTYQWLSTYYGFYQGYLDDVYMFNRALSNSEIEALYHEGGW